MHQLTGIINNQNPETVTLCEDICKELGITLTISENEASFLLQLFENDIHVAFFDCGNKIVGGLNQIKLIRRMRPKIPLIVFCDQVDQENGARMHEEGIFYLGIRPFQRDVIGQVTTAALKFQVN